MKKKVEIVITEGQHYVKSVKNGREFTSVDYSGGRYGGSSPCDNDEEIKRAIEHAKETILKEGDKPVIRDERKKAKLTNWF